MSEKFKNTYRTASARRQKWDCRWDAGYFITICTKNRQHFFGEINDGKMQLSHQGILADVFWHEIDIKNSASNFTPNEGKFLIKDSM